MNNRFSAGAQKGEIAHRISGHFQHFLPFAISSVNLQATASQNEASIKTLHQRLTADAGRLTQEKHESFSEPRKERDEEGNGGLFSDRSVQELLSSCVVVVEETWVMCHFSAVRPEPQRPNVFR